MLSAICVYLLATLSWHSRAASSSGRQWRVYTGVVCNIFCNVAKRPSLNHVSHLIEVHAGITEAKASALTLRSMLLAFALSMRVTAPSIAFTGR